MVHSRRGRIINHDVISSHGNRSAQAMMIACQKRTFANTKTRHDEVLLKSEKEGILTLTLNRPNQRNALNLALLQDLKTTLTKLKNNPNDMTIRAVIIQANGPAFCSGHDLKELLSNCRSSSSEESNTHLIHLCSEVMKLFKSVPQPTIAAVHGVATAAGCQLAASTDLTIASLDSSFATPGINIGLFCSTPAVPLLRIIPRKIALDMLFTGRVLCAREAQKFGLVSRVIELENDDLLDGAESVKREAKVLARLIASKSGHAIRVGKHALYKQADSGSIEEAYAIASKAMLHGMESEDAVCGIHSFLAKESPEWKHR